MDQSHNAERLATQMRDLGDRAAAIQRRMKALIKFGCFKTWVKYADAGYNGYAEFYRGVQQTSSSTLCIVQAQPTLCILLRPPKTDCQGSCAGFRDGGSANRSA